MTTRKKLPVGQPEANPERGEHELTLDGVTYRLRPSFAANVAIERKLERSLVDLVKLGNSGSLSLLQMGVVASEFIKAGAEDEATRHVGAERISEMIYEEGVTTAVSVLTLCLVDAVTGGRDVLGNARAAAA